MNGGLGGQVGVAIGRRIEYGTLPHGIRNESSLGDRHPIAGAVKAKIGQAHESIRISAQLAQGMQVRV